MYPTGTQNPDLPPVGVPTGTTGTGTAPPIFSGGKEGCHDLAIKQCAEQGRPNDSECITQKEYSGFAKNTCYDSPLYLYGEEGQNVKVNVNTYVYNSQPEYDNGYEVTLQNDGKMLINGIVTDSIKYNYIPGIKKIKPPSYGTVAPRYQVAGVLNKYAQKLGLNQKETEDLTSFSEGKLTKPYVFVSFFDRKKSEEILPLSFNPKPDNYLNIVFYFREYDTNPVYAPIPPVFSTPLKRSGFTAVEISGIVE